MTASTGRAWRLLVVDDNPETVRLVRAWYEGQPYEILEADDGKQGLRQAAEHLPDLILLDLKMPGIDGLDVARRLKEDPHTAGIPILLLTACRDLNSKVAAFSAGAEDYVEKPFDFEEVAARIQTILDRRGRILGLESRVRNLTASNDELEKMLKLDEKTGLFNFRTFRQRLEEEWQRAQRYGSPLSLVFLDLDHFKQVNDSLGHQAGDRALQQFATLVAGGARANDLAARYGGEEFAIILPHTGAVEARRVAERTLAAVREFVFLEDESPRRITVSAGVATYPAGPRIDSVDALVRAADRALYEAKRAGRDRVVQDPLPAEAGETGTST